jgi:hypothetical protein
MFDPAPFLADVFDRHFIPQTHRFAIAGHCHRYFRFSAGEEFTRLAFEDSRSKEGLDS